MAESYGSLQLNIDPKSLILSHYSSDITNPTNNNTLQFTTTDSYFMERGPKYKAYAQLRETKLRSRYTQYDEIQQEKEIPRSENITPVKKTVRFQGNLKVPKTGEKQRSSVLAQSVPDFTAVLRKENRKPAESVINRIPRGEKSMTPPPSMSKREKMYGSVVKTGGGSKSVNTGEKQGRVLRKSYANIEELKGLSIAASNAINGEGKGGGRRSNVLRKSTVFSTRYY